MSLIDLIPVILAGSAGLAAGGLVPTSGEKLMAYKVKKQMKKFVVYGFCGWTQWLYPVGVGASWMAAALEASVLKALFFMIISYVMFIVIWTTGIGLYRMKLPLQYCCPVLDMA